MKHSFYVCIAFIVSAFFTHVAGQDTTAPDSTLNTSDQTELQKDMHLKVGVKSIPPFVVLHENNDPSGLSITLWENIIKNTNYTFEYVTYNSLPELLNGVENGEVDLSINPVTVTSGRLEKMEFSQPFFVTSTSFARRAESSFWKVVKNIISWQFIAAVSVLLILLLISGTLVWYFERNKNDQFDVQPWAGIGHGFWWSAVTMTTVGYGDKAPRSFWGRFVAFIWMFTAVIVISSLTASIASSLTVSSIDENIENVRDLKDREVGTVQNSSPAQFLDVYKVENQKYESIGNGLDALVEDEIDFFVFDRPVIKYQIDQNQDYSEELTISEQPLKTDYYSFCFPKGKVKLVDFINSILIEELKSLEWSIELEELR